MSPCDQRPTPQELARWPELAVLAWLHYGLDLTVRALVAAYPELDDPERPHWLPRSPAAPAAQCVLTHADALSRAVTRYRLAITREHDHAEPPPSDDVF
jgi:hypothetical protein